MCIPWLLSGHNICTCWPVSHESRPNTIQQMSGRHVGPYVRGTRHCRPASVSAARTHLSACRPDICRVVSDRVGPCIGALSSGEVTVHWSSRLAARRCRVHRRRVAGDRITDHSDRRQHYGPTTIHSALGRQHGSMDERLTGDTHATHAFLDR